MLQYVTPETLTLFLSSRQIGISEALDYQGLIKHKSADFLALPSGHKKRESLAHRTATTSYPCCLPTLGEFRGSWSCTTFPTANIRIFL